MEIPFYDNEASMFYCQLNAIYFFWFLFWLNRFIGSSEEETCGILDNTSNNVRNLNCFVYLKPALQTLDKEMYLSWELNDNVYENNVRIIMYANR